MKIFNAPVMRISLLSLALLLLTGPIGHGQIAPDLTFSGDGKYFISDGSSREEILDMAIDGQGRIILAGFTNYDPDEGGKSRGLVIRLLPDGNPDPSFVGGKVYIDFPNSNDELYGVAVDNNNNIFLCGRTEIIDAAIFKILGSNGLLDPSFGTSGRSILSAAAMFNDIALTPNNQIVVAGWGIVGNDADFLVAKYNSNGSLDASFGTSGYKTAGTYEDEYANSLAIQSDGKIVVSGYQLTCGTSDNCYDPVLSRFTSSGQLDSGFGLGGMFPIGAAQYEAISFNVAIQNVQGEERILVSGYHEPGNDYYAGFVARYRPNGNPDESFGGSPSGLVTITDLGSTRMTVLPDNKILLLSSNYYYQSPNFYYRIRLMRRNADGSLDTSFGSNGMFDQQIGGFLDYPEVVKTAGNKVYVAGSALQTINNYTDYDGIVARFTDCAGGPSLLTSATNATCGQPNGSVTVTPSGNSPFSYLWSNGQTTATIGNLAANTYFVTVTDANGCSSTATKAVQAVPLASINLAKTDAKCGQNNGSINTTVASGAVSSYLWNNGATTANITNLASGTYTLTATDVNGCTIVKSSTVNNTPPSVFTVNQINPTCAGSNGSISVVLQSGAAITSYAWSTGATSNPVNNLPTGQYSVTLTDVNGCIYTSNVTLSSASVAMLNMTTTNTTCGLPNGSASISAQGGSPIQSYLWSNGATTSTILNLPAGTYTVTATDVNGCTIIDQGTVESSSTFNINLGPDFTIQPGQTATLNAQVPGAVSYQWSTGATSPTIVANAPGTYSVTVTNAEGCTAADAIAVSLVSSSVEPQWAKQITLFPNPTHDVAYVRLKIDRSIDVDLRLMDMTGRVLWQGYQQVPSGESNIEISICKTLPPGQYVVYLSDSEGAAIRKLVVL